MKREDNSTYDLPLLYLLSIEELLQKDKRNNALLERASLRVDGHRREKAAAMKTEKGRAASLGAGLLLQLALGEMLENARQQESAATDILREERGSGVRYYSVGSLLDYLESMPFIPIGYRYGENGKPYFKEYPFYFSLSHSGGYVLCVISRRDVGADIQQWRKGDTRRLAERFFSLREKEVLELEEMKSAGSESSILKQGCPFQADLTLENQAVTALFFRLWARKEAYGKLTGKGLAETVGRNLLPGEEELQDDRKMSWTEREITQQHYNAALNTAGYSMAVCQYKD